MFFFLFKKIQVQNKNNREQKMFKCRETIALIENKRNVRRSELINYRSEKKWYLTSRTCLSISPPGYGLENIFN